MSIFSALSGLLLIIIGVWKYFSRKNRERRKNADEARKLTESGIKNNDASEISAGFDRINRT